MKNLMYVFLLMGVSTLLSCSKDETVAITNEDVEGTWDLNTFKAVVNATISVGGVGGETINTVVTMSNSTVKITFDANGNWSSTGTYTLVAVSAGQTQSSNGSNGIGAGTYTISGGKLLMKSINIDANTTVDEMPLTINSFTAGAKLDMSGTDTSETTDPIFGLTVKSKVDLDMVLEQ